MTLHTRGKTLFSCDHGLTVCLQPKWREYSMKQNFGYLRRRYIAVHLHPPSTPDVERLFHSSGSRNLPTLTSSLKPFLLLVLRTKSRAVCCALAISSGRTLTVLSRGSPGTTSHLSKTSDNIACPCVWILTSVSKPNESITGISPFTL